MLQRYLVLSYLLLPCFIYTMNQWHDQIELSTLNTKFATVHMVQRNGQIVQEGDLECFDGGHPLHHAAVEGKLNVVKLLLKGDAEVDTLNAAGRTALHAAAKNNHIEVVRFLLANKADPNIQDTVRQQTPLHAAAQNGSKEVIALLLQHGADVMLCDTEKHTGFSAAIAFINSDAIFTIIEEAPLKTPIYEEEVKASDQRIIALIWCLKQENIVMPKNALACLLSFMLDGVQNPKVTRLIDNFGSPECKKITNAALRVRQLIPLFMSKTKEGTLPWQWAQAQGCIKIAKFLELTQTSYQQCFRHVYYSYENKLSE